MQPCPDTHASFVQTLLSLHGCWVPRHVPFWHVSFDVQVLPSLQVPPVVGVNRQPLAGTQLSVVHVLPSSQVGATPPTHWPPEQLSAVVHAFPSEQLTPSLPARCAQPFVMSHESTVHGLPSSQLTPTPWQNLAAQVSPVVQALPSLQPVPAATAVCTQAPALHESVVQTLPSLQSTAPVPAQTLLAQMSPVVQLSLSLHASALAVNAQAPATESHASFVQMLPSAQRCAVP